MIEITIIPTGKPSSPRAIEFARKMMASKQQAIEESKEYAKTPEYKAMIQKLIESNTNKQNSQLQKETSPVPTRKIKSNHRKLFVRADDPNLRDKIDAFMKSIDEQDKQP